MKKVTALLIILLLAGSVPAKELHVDKTRINLVKFISDAPVEDFEGITNNIDGYISWEGDDPLNQNVLYFEVDLNTIDTGIGLRNRHMRDNYLETDKFPLAHYTGRATRIEKKSDTEYQVTTEGKFFIHGIENSLTTVGTVVINGDHYHVRTQFDIKLSDFNIKIPQLMFFKIDENMDIILDFHLKVVETE